jgi:hypothetical protein
MTGLFSQFFSLPLQWKFFKVSSSLMLECPPMAYWFFFMGVACLVGLAPLHATDSSLSEGTPASPARPSDAPAEPPPSVPKTPPPIPLVSPDGPVLIRLRDGNTVIPTRLSGYELRVLDVRKTVEVEMADRESFSIEVPIFIYMPTEAAGRPLIAFRGDLSLILRSLIALRNSEKPTLGQMDGAIAHLTSVIALLPDSPDEIPPFSSSDDDPVPGSSYSNAPVIRQTRPETPPTALPAAVASSPSSANSALVPFPPPDATSSAAPPPVTVFPSSPPLESSRPSSITTVPVSD